VHSALVGNVRQANLLTKIPSTETPLAPAGAAAAPAAENPAGSPVPAVSIDSQQSEEEGGRLLIVSNDTVSLDLLRTVQGVGFEFDVCDFSQALVSLKTNAYHAALVNAGASQEAFSLIAQARTLSHCRQVPIAALVESRDVNAAFRSGASFTLPLPVSPELLENTLGAIYRIAVGLRRQFARYRVQVPLTLLLGGRTIEAKVTDIGTGGMALVASEPLASGASVSVRFLLPGSEHEIVAAGEIRWTDHLGRAGLCFNTLAEGGRAALDDWMACRHLGMETAPVRLSRPGPDPLANTFELATTHGSRGRVLLGVFLGIFCLLMLGFWIYFAATS
jgi:PilZ domain